MIKSLSFAFLFFVLTATSASANRESYGISYRLVLKASDGTVFQSDRIDLNKSYSTVKDGNLRNDINLDTEIANGTITQETLNTISSDIKAEQSKISSQTTLSCDYINQYPTLDSNKKPITFEVKRDNNSKVIPQDFSATGVSFYVDRWYDTSDQQEGGNDIVATKLFSTYNFTKEIPTKVTVVD